MDLKDKYLDRIADALEEQMGVSPKLIGGNVLKPNIYRIADALDPEPTPLQDGTLKNPLARIAEVIESGKFGGGGKPKIIKGISMPDRSIGNNYDFYTFNNRLFIKNNGFWFYLGILEKDQMLKIPDGEVIPCNYFVSDRAGDKLSHNSYYITNILNNNLLLILPYSYYNLNDFTDEEKDTVKTNDIGFLALAKQSQIINQTFNKSNSAIKTENFNLYEHNNYLTVVPGILHSMTLWDNKTTANRPEFELYNDMRQQVEKYYFQSQTSPNRINYLDYKGQEDGYVTLRLMDETVIKAVHRFIFNEA